jgi:hypothetical protein
MMILGFLNTFTKMPKTLEQLEETGGDWRKLEVFGILLQTPLLTIL